MLPLFPKILLFFILTTFVLSLSFFFAFEVQAQALENLKSALSNLGKAGGEAGFNPQDSAKPAVEIAAFVGRIIQWFLMLIGVILLILLVYGGNLYMTAAGNEEQIKKAKTTINQAIIGLAIIFAAYFVASFTIDYILKSAKIIPE